MTDIESKMAELAARFAARAVDERNTFLALLATGDRATIAERAHKLAGIAGMYGHPRITDASLALEIAVEEGRSIDSEARLLVDLLAAIQTG